ncbi:MULTISPECIES: M48 family metallopeptidase [Paenibacillus]|uniref:M48 family metallopeptidase n=1 Tax=Paenibacillus TaxID=44249 RepID=UPI000475F70A|nr:SprT family zinc-dependent metalloprotease [Paenibacillus massiliensis]
MNVEIDGHVIHCHVQYTKGSKLTVTLDLPYMLTIKAPRHTSHEMLEQWVRERGDAIVRQSKLLAQRLEGPQAREYEADARFMYLGREQALHELIGVEGLNEEQRRAELKRFYFAACKKVIQERIVAYQQKLKVKPKSIDIVESQTKWGSCSWDKKLTFNYRLIMAPPEVIDYVIVHELCHILHMNHDRSFWRKVGSIMPDYESKEAYLRIHGREMSL